ncbi:hypothetical protein [Collimonas pratensis]|uniref:Transmembrane protein n=1 Tax=Collimonas pratensis TaxID=279113 RepID=A0ABN4M7U9_9BURK|nr:hypothetical protein [Collimonas pratensis]AMP13691.1 hypothetical protein CPter291_1417 [Collimonas pratensis]
MMATIWSTLVHHWAVLAGGGAAAGILIALVMALGPGAVLGMLKMVPRWCWEVLIVLVLLLAYGAHERGAIQAKWDKEKREQAQAVTEIQGQQEAVTTQTITQYVNRDRVVYVQGATITKQVPIYVTAQNNAQCVINNGFVRLWNAANTGVQLPDAAVPADGEASGVVLSEVATQHSVESTYTRRLEVQLETWQDWATGQQAAARIKVQPVETSP